MKGHVRYEAAFLESYDKIIYLSDLDSEFKYLYIMDTDSSNYRKVGKDYKWELNGLQVSLDSRTLLF